MVETLESKAISQKIIDILRDRLELAKEQVSETDSFDLDLQMDSLDKYEILYAVEDEMGVSIPDEKAGEFNNVRDYVRYIEAQKSKR
jgi:acyl carrier protein